MEAAAKSGKPVVIYFTQENCVWCDRVENLLNRSELQSKLVDSYHFVNVDIGMANKQSWNAELTKMLSVRGTLAFAAIKASGDHALHELRHYSGRRRTRALSCKYSVAK